MEPSRLSAISLFTALDDDQLRQLSDIVTELEFRAGETVMEEGDFGAAMFAIEAGTTDVLRDGVRVATLGPGDVFGEIAIARSGRRIATVRATSDLRLLTVLNRDVWRLERESPATAAALLALVEQRTTETLGAT